MATAKAKVARLGKPLERAIADGHPWVFADALARPLDVPAGTELDLHDRRDRFLARGLADGGPIAMRLFGLRRDSIDIELFSRRMTAALELRDWLAVPDTTALRWVHGEGDRIPGLVCDLYGSCLIVAFDGDGIAARRDDVVAALLPLALARGVTEVAIKRGRGQAKTLEPVAGVVPVGSFEVLERGMKMLVDVGEGQKTGLFLDHRDSRARVRALASGRRVLNLYGYTGGFSLAAGLGGAKHVTTVDQSAPALALAEDSWLRNGLPSGRHRTVAGDVRAFLEAETAGYDLIVCDPPSFAPNRRSVEAAVAAYRQLHAAVVSKVVDGGLLLAASCSAHVDRTMFDETLRAGARGAKRHLQVIGRWGAGGDHPVPLGFSEGEYLKATLCRVSER